ncbi:hypothetical protein B0H13DRAFT_2282455 [Mycena leptocephala]|nr:hypothetical protein B0H13DRAFT_2282455 [Mycena leptocephala]
MVFQWEPKVLLKKSVDYDVPDASGGGQVAKQFDKLKSRHAKHKSGISTVPASKTMTASNHAVIPLEPSRLQEYVSCSFKPSASPPAPVPAHLKIRDVALHTSYSKYPPVSSSGRGMSMSSPRRETKSTLATSTPFFLRLVSDTGLRDVFQHLTPCVTYCKLGDYCEGRWPRSRAGSKIINTAFNLNHGSVYGSR